EFEHFTYSGGFLLSPKASPSATCIEREAAHVKFGVKFPSKGGRQRSLARKCLSFDEAPRMRSLRRGAHSQRTSSKFLREAGGTGDSCWSRRREADHQLRGG